jgi:hypothetical protein
MPFSIFQHSQTFKKLEAILHPLIYSNSDVWNAMTYVQ